MNIKYFFTIMLILFLLWGCEKDEIDVELNYYENLFEIKDDPLDSVQHRVYELYKKYNVEEVSKKNGKFAIAIVVLIVIGVINLLMQMIS